MRYLFILFFVFMTFAPVANAQFTSNTTVHTITEIKEMEDDTHVIAEGFITERVGDEKYLFQDDTGEIRIDIDDNIWRGREVNAETKIRIFGEFEKERRSMEIEVDRFEVL